MMTKLLAMLGSKRARQLSVLSTAVEGVTSLKRGERRTGLLLLGVAAISYKRSELGYIAQAVAKLYKRRRP